MSAPTGYFGVGADAAGGQPRLWERLTWPAIERLQADGERLVLMPVGALEQHGPHLPLNTDVVIAGAVCGYASARTGVPVLPTLPVAVSVGHTQHWPGTVSVMHETLIACVREMVAWVKAAGFDRILVVNSHAGNAATLSVAIDQLRYTYGSALQVGLVATYAVSDSVRDYFFSDAGDIHANRAETDLMLYLDPAACAMDQVADDPDRTDGTVFSYTVARTSRNGVTGQPSLGDGDQGRALLQEMGEALAATVERGRLETAPLETATP